MKSWLNQPHRTRLDIGATGTVDGKCFFNLKLLKPLTNYCSKASSSNPLTSFQATHTEKKRKYRWVCQGMNRRGHIYSQKFFLVMFLSTNFCFLYAKIFLFLYIFIIFSFSLLCAITFLLDGVSFSLLRLFDLLRPEFFFPHSRFIHVFFAENYLWMVIFNNFHCKTNLRLFWDSAGLQLWACWRYWNTSGPG